MAESAGAFILDLNQTKATKDGKVTRLVLRQPNTSRLYLLKNPRMEFIEIIRPSTGGVCTMTFEASSEVITDTKVPPRKWLGKGGIK